MGMIDAVKIMRDAELKAESNKITLGEYEAMIRPLRQVMTKADYETRLKADMAAMLTGLQLEIEEIKIDVPFGFEPVSKTSAFYEGVSASSKVIQQKINALKGDSDG